MAFSSSSLTPAAFRRISSFVDESYSPGLLLIVATMTDSGISLFTIVNTSSLVRGFPF